MPNELVQGLLQDLLRPQKGPAPADIMAAISAQNPMAAVAAMQAPQLGQMFGQQFRGLIGGLRGQPAPLTADEAMAAAIRQIAAQPDLMNSSAGMNQLAKAASVVGRTAEAMQFSLMASQLKQEEDARKAGEDAAITNQGAGLSYIAGLVQSTDNEEIKNSLSALTPLIRPGGLTIDKLPGLANDIFKEHGEEAPSNQGMASAVTKAYLDGTVLQALPNGETIVRDSTGAIVPPERRTEVLQQAALFEQEQAGGAARARAEGTASIARADKYMEQAGGVRLGLTQIDEAVRLLDEGANTGRVAALFPSVRQSTLALEQLQSEMGLNVVQNTTFGALSEGELSLALATALPTNLSPPALKDWLLRKKDAQQKLLRYTENAAAFLYSGGSMADWIKEQSSLQELQERASEAPETRTLPDGTVVTVRRAG